MASRATVVGAPDLIRIEDAEAGGDFVMLCDHASNRVPPGFGELGLSDETMRLHIAWDPGALSVARSVARRLEAPLVYPDASRLLIDCNRAPLAPDSIAAVSEDTPIPGNRNLAADVRRDRIALIYNAYHGAVDALIEARAGMSPALVAVHSFTPTYLGAKRPWHVGVVGGDDRRLADPVLAILRAEAGLVVGENEPYSPVDGVYHTIERHAGKRGLPAVMIEIRNDLIATEAAQEAWAKRLASALAAALRKATDPPVADRIGH